MGWRCAAIAAVLSGCVQSTVVPCGDGVVCPSGTTCAKVTEPAQELCVASEQLTSCKDAPRFRACSTAKIAAGRCYDGVCLATGCGNGRIDKADPGVAMDTGEVCDDGNQKSGDGCSADCTSDETCGNGTVDAVAGEVCDDGGRSDNDGCDSLCAAEQTQWFKRLEGDPTTLGHREGYALAYDVARNQVVMFGGRDVDSSSGARTDLAETWVYDGHGWMQMITPVAPPARTGHTMAYDTHRQRIVMFGGYSEEASTVLGDTWEWDGVRWEARTSSSSPAARTGHAMTYDAKRKVVVVYGGDKNPGASYITPSYQYSDTWLWDGANWTQQTSANAPNCVGSYLAADNGRSGAAFAFDEARGASVLFGGGCFYLQPAGGGFYQYPGTSDTKVWELDASGWTAKTASGPTVRRGASMAFSPASHQVLMFGGTNPTEQWEWNGQAWQQNTTATLPAHQDSAIATDPERGVLVMYSTEPSSNETTTQEWNGTDWSAPITTDRPIYDFAVAVHDTRRDRDVLISSAGEPFERVGTAWHKLAPVLPENQRMGVYDEALGKTVVLAQTSDAAAPLQTWTWDGAAWTQITTAGLPPRTASALAYDRKRQRVVLFGGEDSALFGETWLFDGATWTQATPATSPPPAAQSAMAYDPIREVTVLVGGRTDTGVIPGTWIWDGTTWTETGATGPQPRYSAALAFHPTRRRLTLIGGYTQNGIGLSDIWEWTGSAWSHVAASSTLFGRGDAILLPTRDGAGLVWQGGYVVAPGFGARAVQDDAELRWQGTGVRDSCTDSLDLDRDGLAGCADPDCSTTCGSCGDNTCEPDLESCRSCPADCGACTPACGDGYCDPGETAATCSGDC